MAKRLTDSRKWQDDWFLELEKDYKLFWVYLLDTCDHIGLYKPALKLANFCLKTDFTEDMILNVFSDRIIKLDSGKWFIPKFIRFQYGLLSSKSAFHIRILKDLGTSLPKDIFEKLDIVSTECQQGSPTLKDTRTYKDTSKDKDLKEEGVIGETNPYNDFEQTILTKWNEFCKKHPILSSISSVTGTRRKHLKQRFQEPLFKNFDKILDAIENQPFLLNGNSQSKEHKDWKVSFDWIICNDTNFVKVLERKYKKQYESLLDKYEVVK